MRYALISVLVVVLLATTLTGCVSDGLGAGEAVASGAPTEGDPNGSVDPRLGTAIADFGFKLLKQSSAESEGNVVVSPLSAHAALSMTYNGASGDTSGQMAGTLALLDLGQSDMNEAYANLLASLNGLPEESGVTLSVANSLWADEGFPLDETFVDTDRKYFGAQLETLDLQDPAAADEINGWVADQTNDKITELIDEIPADAVAYLINAVYLKGDWSVPFDPELTASEPFTVATGTEVDVPMMRRGGSYTYTEADGTQAVRLPYGDGRFAMWVVLPAQGGGDPRDAASRAIDRLAEGDWSEITGSATQREGEVVMPTFTTRTKTDLSAALSAMGMPLAFDTEAADFSGMSPMGADLFISRVLHETYIAVDETGTEAAAATGVEMGLTAAPMPSEQEPFEMVVDRPFLFVIEDVNTAAILFTGVIEDPR